MGQYQTWQQFKHMLDMAHPKRGDTLQLPLMADFTPRLPPPEPSQGSLFDDEAAN
jgi:hypothetical protein